MRAGEVTIFSNLDKGHVLQQTRMFSANDLNVSECVTVLARILYRTHQGTVFDPREASDIFFAATKLFQSKDVL